jgi:phosphopantetheine adenylyltransferase
MSTILVVANETLGGAKLIEAIQAKAGPQDRVVICVPRNRPREGYVIYDDAVYDAAQVRIDLARQFLRERGLNAVGDVGDPDPYTAAMDAVAEWRPSEIIVSTYPATSSGWMRRDIIERISDATGLPVTHVITDVDTEGLPFDVTLVVANRTAAGDELLQHLRSKKGDGGRERLFIVVVPQEGGGGTAAQAARGRLGQVLDRLRSENILCAGMIGDPDPYTATMNALQFFRVDDIVISTLPATRSGWLRADLIERVRRATNTPVEHVEATAPVEA